MESASKPVRFTVTIDNPTLHDAARQLAAEQKKPLKTVMAEALRLWIEHQEDLEDLAAIAEVEHEETIPWEVVKAELAVLRAKERKIKPLRPVRRRISVR